MALNNGASSNAASIPVSGIFTDGTQLQDPLSGVTYTVESGAVAVTLSSRSGVVLLPYPASVDLIPPTGSATLSPAANSNGWNNSVPVTVNLSATDSGGSGVNELRYWVDSAPTIVTLGSSASITFSSEGRSTVHLRALDNANNISPLVNQSVNIDLTPPVVNVSASPATLWPPNGKMVSVMVSGTITDNLSGVDPSKAAFTVVDECGVVQPGGPVSLGAGGSYSFTVSLQASRNGNSMNGRHYAITVSTKDLAGNLGSASTVVTVPHDQRQ